MIGNLVARASALVFLALGLVALALTVRAWPHDGAFRVVARLTFVLMLLGAGHAAWRIPARRPARLRKRTLDLLAIVADPDGLADFAETTPQVPVAVALIDDWERARRERERVGAQAFTPAELAALRPVDAAAPPAGALDALLAPEVATRPEWRSWAHAAQAARRAFAAP